MRKREREGRGRESQKENARERERDSEVRETKREREREHLFIVSPKSDTFARRPRSTLVSRDGKLRRRNRF
jgi:hypothetical protein